MSKLSPTEAKAIGEARESWCAVEMKKEVPLLPCNDKTILILIIYPYIIKRFNI
jgi:hypothetical protein